jgi:hypothetical protein
MHFSKSQHGPASYTSVLADVNATGDEILEVVKERPGEHHILTKRADGRRRKHYFDDEPTISKAVAAHGWSAADKAKVAAFVKEFKSKTGTFTATPELAAKLNDLAKQIEALEKGTPDKYHIPTDAIDDVLNRLREAWQLAYPDSKPTKPGKTLPTDDTTEPASNSETDMTKDVHSFDKAAITNRENGLSRQDALRKARQEDPSAFAAQQHLPRMARIGTETQKLAVRTHYDAMNKASEPFAKRVSELVAKGMKRQVAMATARKEDPAGFEAFQTAGSQ